MCKSSQPQGSSEAAPVAMEVPTNDLYDLAKACAIPDNEQPHQEVIAHDEASGIVVFGSFVAGALVGIVICAPAFVVLLFGAGAAAVTKSDSKVGKFSRKVGKVSSDVLLAVLRFAREYNHKHKLTHKAKVGAKEAAGKVTDKVRKLGIVDNVKARASSLWDQVDKRTAPAGQASIQVAQAQDLSHVTDGTRIPFDGATDAHVIDSSSSSSSNGGKPKSFDA
ncbi:unnamed protein product [Ectocarpus sp. CCAP 1310/34]|nr:unnamed protein product [Ectocarpus sp. CCAP 1310/34]